MTPKHASYLYRPLFLPCRKVGDVCFWHLADITARSTDVRFWG
jgi:hypothetical protein